MSYTLQQAVEFIKENRDNLMALSENPEILEYIDSIQDAGMRVLVPLGNENLSGAVALIQAAVLTHLLMGGKVGEMLSLMQDMDTFNEIIAISMKYSVGMTITEEWR